jgi:hypothetical protein
MPESRTERFNRLFAEAYDLISTGHPSRAIRTARTAAALVPDHWHSALNLGGILVDAGTRRHKSALVREGIQILEAGIESAPDDAKRHFHYNIGTAYSELSAKERGHGPLTRRSARAAIEHLAQATASFEETPDQWVNLAGVLCVQGRYVEAIDILGNVVRAHPAHHQALAMRSKALTGMHRWTWRHRGLLEIAAMDLMLAIKSAMLTAPDYAISYSGAVAALHAQIGTEPPQITPGQATPLEDWIWESGLAFNFCPLCHIERPDSFDTYVVEGFLHAPKRRPSSEEVAETVNSWHRSYATARWHLAQAAGCAGQLPTDHVPTVTGFVGSDQGLRIGLLAAGLTEFHAILDQIAYGLNAILSLGHDPEKVNFTNMWGKRGWKQKQQGRPSIPDERDDVHPQLRRGASQSLAALYHLSWSFAVGEGMYRSLRKLRDQTAHHVVVVTSIDVSSSVVHTISATELERQALAMGRLAKAAMWYAGGAIWWYEADRVRRARRQGELVGAGRRTQVNRQ